MAANPPASAGSASSIGKPPVDGAVVPVVTVVVAGRDTNGVGVRNRNGVGVTSCWANPSDLANVSDARATAPWAVSHSASSSAAPANQRPAFTLLVGMSSSPPCAGPVLSQSHSKHGWTRALSRHVTSDRAPQASGGAEQAENEKQPAC